MASAKWKPKSGRQLTLSPWDSPLASLVLIGILLCAMFAIGVLIWGGWPDDPFGARYCLENNGRIFEVSRRTWITMYILQLGMFVGVILMFSAGFQNI